MLKETGRVLLTSLLPGVLLILSQPGSGLETQSYHYLGCHTDDPLQRDLNGIGYSLTVVHLDDCASKCRSEGYAYVGLQNGQQCFCGTSYGKHGITSAYKCNYSCDALKCGGYQTNSVYYSIRKDTASQEARVLEAHSEALTFTEARKVCVKYDGDLAPIKDTSMLKDVLDVADNTQAETNKFWFGLRKVNQKFEWTDTTLSYDPAEYTSFWASAETFQLSCAVVDNRTEEWETSSCSGTRPFICLQKPTPPTEAPTTAGTGGDGSTDEGSAFSRQTKITMYVIIPIFFFCYGGSCLLYVISKCYKAFRRRQRRKEQQDYLTEFDPDTKPFSLTNSSTPVYPITPRDINLNDKNYPQKPTTLDPAPPYRKIKGPERPVHTPVMTFYPDIQGNPKPMPRAKTPQEEKAEAKMAREETRRNRLLQNALNEARERRRGDTPSDLERPASDSSNEFPRPPTGPPRKRPTGHPKRNPGGGSPESMDLLLPKQQPKPNSDAVIDFTKLSIQDIIQIKQLMGQAKKSKPKKILTA